MKLADESIKIEENLVFGGDKFDRSSEHSHGDLLALIDFKRSRISLHKSEFQGTINAMERNTKLAGAGVFVNAGFIILLIIIFFVTESSGSFGIAFRGIVILAICYLIYSEVINIIKYLIHTKGICMISFQPLMSSRKQFMKQYFKSYYNIEVQNTIILYNGNITVPYSYTCCSISVQ